MGCCSSQAARATKPSHLKPERQIVQSSEPSELPETTQGTIPVDVFNAESFKEVQLELQPPDTHHGEPMPLGSSDQSNQSSEDCAEQLEHCPCGQPGQQVSRVEAVRESEPAPPIRISGQSNGLDRDDHEQVRCYPYHKIAQPESQIEATQQNEPTSELRDSGQACRSPEQDPEQLGHCQNHQSSQVAAQVQQAECAEPASSIMPAATWPKAKALLPASQARSASPATPATSLPSPAPPAPSVITSQPGHQETLAKPGHVVQPERAIQGNDTPEPDLFANSAHSAVGSQEQVDVQVHTAAGQQAQPNPPAQPETKQVQPVQPTQPAPTVPLPAAPLPVQFVGPLQTTQPVTPCSSKTVPRVAGPRANAWPQKPDESVVWTDHDGDIVGFHRIGQLMYAMANDKPFEPMGPAHVVRLLLLDGSFQAEDSRLAVYSNDLPCEHVGRLEKMWAKCLGAAAAHQSQPPVQLIVPDSTSHAAPTGFTSHAKDMQFVDTEFPTTLVSIGTPKPGRSFISNEQKAAIRWIRIPELLELNGLVAESNLTNVVCDDIDPNDLTQGSIGNCWLISTIAALAEFPSTVRRLFVESDVALGRYIIKLYDMNAAKWEHVTIDDYIPCARDYDWSCAPCTIDGEGRKVYQYADIRNQDGSMKLPARWVPQFGRPKGRKVWALLLEKAMAKFIGSYAGIAGGSEPYALMAFTGFPIVYCFTRPALDEAETAALLGEWEWLGAQYHSRPVTGPVPTKIPSIQSSLSDDEMWSLLLDFDARNYLMTASITRFVAPETTRGYFRNDGLVIGHAYSLLSGKAVVTSGGEWAGLVKLRNPHGEGDATPDGIFSTKWRGSWSDRSSLWDAHPEVAEQVNFNPKNDGTFWMCWSDFVRTFDKLSVLPKSMDERRGGLRPFVQRHQASVVPASVGISLAKMADEEMWLHFSQLRAVYDPFVTLPGFLSDGTLETELCWAASKPGHLQRYLDLNRSSGNDFGYNAITVIIQKLGLTEALGPDGYVGGLMQEGQRDPSVTVARRPALPKRRARSRSLSEERCHTELTSLGGSQ